MLWKELDGRFVDPSERYLCHAGGGIVAEPGINVLPDVNVIASEATGGGGLLEGLGAGLGGALDVAGPLSLLAFPLESLFGLFGAAPLSGVPSIVGPIAQSLGLPATTSMEQLTSDIAAAGFTPEQISGYLSQNLPKLASIMQEGQPQALGDILSSGLLGQQTTAVGSEFAPQLEQAAVASGQVSPGDAVQFLQAFGDITPQAAAALTGGAGGGAGAATPALAPTDVAPPLASPTGGLEGAAPGLALAGGAPSALGSILNAVNPVGTALAQDMPSVTGALGGTGGAAAGQPTVDVSQNFGQPQGATPSRINLPGAAGGAAGGGTTAATPAGGSSLVAGGAIGPSPAAPGAAPPELNVDLSGLSTGVSGGGAGAAVPPPAPPPTAPQNLLSYQQAPAAPAAAPAPAPAPAAPPATTTPTGSAAGQPSYADVTQAVDKGTLVGEDQSWFSGVKDWLKENSGLLTAGGLGVTLLSALMNNKLPQQASSATQAANAALGPSGAAFNTAAGDLVPAATTNLADTITRTQPIISGQTALAQQEQAAALPLLAAETTGQLPPGTADAIRQALATSRAGIASGYGNLNLAGSTSEAQDIAASSGNIIAQIPGILSSLVNQGIQMGQGSTQASGEALSGLGTILNAVQGLTGAVQGETQAAGGFTNAAQVASNANLNFADLQLKADQELQTALAGLSRNLALSQISPSSTTLQIS